MKNIRMICVLMFLGLISVVGKSRLIGMDMKETEIPDQEISQAILSGISAQKDDEINSSVFKTSKALYTKRIVKGIQMLNAILAHIDKFPENNVDALDRCVTEPLIKTACKLMTHRNNIIYGFVDQFSTTLASYDINDQHASNKKRLTTFASKMTAALNELNEDTFD
jgi:hypothetical protein